MNRQILNSLLVRVGSIYLVGVLSLGATAQGAATISLKAVAKNGTAITPTSTLSVAPNDTVTAEVLISGWNSPNFDGATGLINKYRVTLSGAAAAISNGADPTDNTRLVLPVGWNGPVNQDPCPCDNPLFANCDQRFGCVGAGHTPDNAVSFESLRADFVFDGLGGPRVTGVGALDSIYWYGQTSQGHGQSASRCSGGAEVGRSCTSNAECPGSICDANYESYAGTLELKVGSNACGTFTFNLTADPERTAICNPSNFCTLPLLQGLTLRVTDGICRDRVLILEPTVSGGLNSLEAQRAIALGQQVDVITDVEWRALGAADFSRYRAIILGDPRCSTDISDLAAAQDTTHLWGPAVTGNVIIIGTDPSWHQNTGSVALIDGAIAFALADSTRTGAYITLSCYYHNAAPFTPVPLLDAFVPGGFTVRNNWYLNDVHIVATHPTLAGLTDASLSNWNYSVHEAFDSWPDTFHVFAIARNFGSSYTATDGSIGTPYILSREVTINTNIALAPSLNQRSLGASQTLRASVTRDDGIPIAGALVDFEVLEGPHIGQAATAVTNIDGVVDFSYIGHTIGVDTVRARFTDTQGTIRTSNTVTVEWVPAPTIQCSGPWNGLCSPDGVEVQMSATVHDSKGQALEVSWNVNGGIVQVVPIPPTNNPPTTETISLAHTFFRGENSVVAEVTDQTGGSAECDISVNLSDFDAPSVFCPPDQAAAVCIDAPIPDLRSLISARDNCTPVEELVIGQMPAPSTLVGPGSHEITIRVEDGSQNVGTCTAAFIVEIDQTGPSSFNIQPYPDRFAVVIQWSTDEPSTSQVSYGLTPEYGQVSPIDLTLRTLHEVPITNLLPNMAYHFKVLSGDGCGNIVSSADRVFTTLPAPNLHVANIEVPTVGLTDQFASVTWTVENNGATEATLPWSDRLFISTDNHFGDGNDSALQTLSAPSALSESESYGRTATFALPSLPGDYWIVVVTDVGNEVTENSENDNVAIAKAPIHVEQTPIPDLVVLSVTSPSSGVLSGSVVQVTYVVKNQGNGPTETTTWTDGIYLSTTVGQLGNLIRSVSNPQFLLVGGSYSQTVDIQLPEDVTGTYFIGVGTDRTGRVSEAVENNNTKMGGEFFISLAPQPDLIAEDIAFPSKAFSAENMAVTWLDRNQGEGPTDSGSWIDAVYLSPNISPSIDPGDILLGTASRSGTPLQSGETDSSRSLTKFIPPDIDGQFFVKIRVDTNNQVSEFGAEGNNVAVSADPINVILSVSVDLVPSAISGPPSGIPGHNVQVTWSAENICAEPAFALSWTDKVYISPDPVFGNANDRFLGSSNHQTITDCAGCPGEGVLLDPYTNTRTFRLPNDLAAGDYVVFVVVDADNAVFEGGCPNGESNNVLASTSTIHVSLVPTDLTIEVNFDGGQLLPTSAAAGQSVHISWRVTNTGQAVTPVSSWQDRIYLSSNTIVDGGDIQLGSFIHSGVLAPGGSYVGEQNHAVPLVAAGSYHLLFVTDASGEVYEQPPGENNNVAFSAFTVVPDASDLSILDPVVPEHALSGQPVLFEWTVINEGTLPTNASAWVDQVYLSVDAVPGGDQPLCSMTHSGTLGVGQSYRASLSCTLPINLAGLFYVVKRTDVQNAVFETNDNNNVIVKPMLIDVELSPPANLVVSRVDAAESALSGQSLDVTWTVENAGEGPTNGPSWSDSVYLSRDSFLDPGFDQFLGSVSHQGFLAPGQSYTQTRTLGIPFGVSGPYFAIVVTDSANQVFENQNEGDNVGVDPELITITIPQPSDLIVGPTITPPTSGVLGETAFFSWEITNGGTEVVTGSWQDSIYLSTDEFWDINDRRVATITRPSSVLNPGDSTTVTGSGPIPAVLPGLYHAIVRADVFNQIPETNEQNNLGTSAGTFEVTAIPLQLGVPYQDSLAAGEDKYFELAMSAEKTVRIALDHVDPLAWTEMYVRFNDVPTPGQFDFIFASPGQPSQQILIPTSKVGRYYILVKGVVVPSSPQMRLLAEEQPFAITSYEPTRGGDSGFVTLSIHGAQFHNNTIVALEGSDQRVIQPSGIFFINASLILAEFDLRGATRGEYYLVAEDAANQQSVAPAVFVIEVGVQNALTIEVAGPSAIRPNTASRFSAVVRNTGNVDGDYVLVTVSVPDQPSIEMRLNIGDQYIDGLNLADMDTTFSTDEGATHAVFAPFLPPSRSVIIPIDLRVDGAEASVRLAMGTRGIQEDELGNLVDELATCGGSVSCSDIRRFVRNGLLPNPTGYIWAPLAAFVVFFGALFFGVPLLGALGLAGVISGLVGLGPRLNYLMRLADFAHRETNIAVVRPIDPNEKHGPRGFGAERFISSQATVAYDIFFENLPEATSSTSRVVITDPIDRTLNIGSFRVGRIHFGDTVVDVPGNRISYQSRIDLRATRGVFVDIIAGVNASTREAFWIFQTIDPDTGEPPIDPQEGFLPPNLVSPQGEGIVEYTIKPASSAATGTVIRNSATIMFDLNEAILTNEVFNTLDADAPASAVGPLPPIISGPVIPLTWIGEDSAGGSGLAGYSIYYSINDGPFIPLVNNTADVTFVLNGQPGSTYAFYSIAIDNAGNLEQPPSEPDTVTYMGPGIISSDPSSGAIDPRRPIDRQGNPVGWKRVTLDFGNTPAFVGASDFLIESSLGDPPNIQTVTIQGNTVHLDFDRPISPGAWTTVTHTASATKVCLGYLPADVDASRSSAASDIVSLINNLNLVTVPPYPIWQCDVDRSNSCTPADLLTLIDLLNGTNGFEIWSGRSLGPSPCDGR